MPELLVLGKLVAETFVVGTVMAEALEAVTELATVGTPVVLGTPVAFSTFVVLGTVAAVTFGAATRVTLTRRVCMTVWTAVVTDEVCVMVHGQLVIVRVVACLPR